MKFTYFQRKSVSLIVLVTFVALLHFWATPAPAATSAGNSETTIARGDSGGPGFIEEESSTGPVIKKEKKFPWLFVGLGVIAIGVAVYFLVLKKTKYTLTVTLDANCTGTPAATGKHNKGTVVAYTYTAAAGYAVKVNLDGVDVADSGSITMDKDHTLSVTATPLDIRGTWQFTCTGLSANSFHAVFAGTTTSGTVKLTEYTNKGTYKVTGENVNFTITGPIVFTGKFESSNIMSGTHSYGGWSATRTSTAAVSMPQGAVENIVGK